MVPYGEFDFVITAGNLLTIAVLCAALAWLFHRLSQGLHRLLTDAKIGRAHV